MDRYVLIHNLNYLLLCVYTFKAAITLTHVDGQAREVMEERNLSHDALSLRYVAPWVQLYEYKNRFNQEESNS